VDGGTSSEKWCLLMNNRGAGTGQRDAGSALIRERHIVSPTKRNRVPSKLRTSRSLQDESDIRLEAERSMSRDRDDRTSKEAAYVSPALQRYDYGANQFKTPNRPMSLLNNPTRLGSSIGDSGHYGSSNNSHHPPTPTFAQSGVKLSNQQVCINFSKGTCKHGLSCRYKHVVNAGLESASTTNDQK
jgi:hypothetical protein